MIKRIKDFLSKHYLVVGYSSIALAFVLYILLHNDLKYLVHFTACLVVILLFAIFSGLIYIIVRGLITDHHLCKKDLRNAIIVAAVLGLFYLLLNNGLGVPDTGLIYMLAPLVSLPAILAVIILNMCTKWRIRRDKKREAREANEKA